MYILYSGESFGIQYLKNYEFVSVIKICKKLIFLHVLKGKSKVAGPGADTGMILSLRERYLCPQCYADLTTQETKPVIILL